MVHERRNWPPGRLKNIPDTLMVTGETADRNKHEIYEFGPFRLELAERKLSRDSEDVALTPKVFDMLVMLVRNNGHLLEKESYPIALAGLVRRGRQSVQQYFRVAEGVGNRSRVH